MRSWPLAIFGVILSILIISALIYSKRFANQPMNGVIMSQASSDSSPTATPSSSPLVAPAASSSPVAGTTSPNAAPDLTADSNGLSKATWVINTTQGPIQIKFYPKDAPKTVNRIIELVQQGFYNGLSFHRVVPGFVIQGGDPVGNGTGGSGKKLEAEFNDRKHIEGTVSMARASDPNSADSQFYICLGTHPHLDHNYTVFGQVIEGMDAVKKIQVGDKMMSLKVE